MATEAQVFIDGNDVSHLALEGSVTRRLNAPWQAQVRLPMQDAIGDVGSLLKIYLSNSVLGTMPVLWFHGRVLLIEDSADENTGYTVYNATDPLELWQWRPVRDADGDFTAPDIIKTNSTGPAIVEAMFDNSEDAADMPDDAEGPLFLTKGNFAGGGVSMVGAPIDWPMTMAELATLLVSTGEVDIVCTPIEPENSGYTCDGHIVWNYGRLDVYNGDYGYDLTSSVAFQYGMGLYNIRSIRRNQDMSRMVNKLWYYLGPRLDQQHWQANITGDDPAFNPPGGAMVPPGGRLSPPASATNNQVGVLAYSSRCAYGVRMEVKTYDSRGDEAYVAHDLYRRLWQIEQWLRAQPQTLVHITPTRDEDIGEFDIGDLVLVEACTDFRGGFSGAQRVYEYTVSWDTDSVPAIGELQVSGDNEGFS